MTPLTKEQYGDFLAGVHSTSWLHQLSKVQINERVSSAPKEEGAPEAPLTKPVAEAAAAPVKWTPARIAGVVTGVVFSFALLLIGILMVSGVIAFAKAVIVEPSPSPPPPPPPPPPLPRAPPLSSSVALLERPGCHIALAGEFVSRVGNGLCEDGGSGSVSNVCPVGYAAAFELYTCTLHFHHASYAQLLVRTFEISLALQVRLTRLPLAIHGAFAAATEPRLASRRAGEPHDLQHVHVVHSSGPHGSISAVARLQSPAAPRKATQAASMDGHSRRRGPPSPHACLHAAERCIGPRA
jgi:hypothetical protein